MASDILITPNKGSAVNNAKIEFTGATSESSTMRIEVSPNGALSFIGSGGTAGIGIDGSITTTIGSAISYAAAETYLIWSDEPEYSVVDDATDANYKTVKTFVASKSGTFKFKFSGYIQSGTYYFAWRVLKNGSTVVASGLFNSGLDTGEAASVHAYRRFVGTVSSIQAGDSFALQMVSSTGGGSPVAGNGQLLYAKEFRVYSSIPSVEHGGLSNVWGANVGIGTTSPSYHLQVAGTGTETSVASFRYDTGIIGEVGILSDATGGLLFARDGTGTSNTQINGKTNGHSYFNSGGNVGIGTTNTDPLSLSRDRNLAIVTTGTNAALTLVGGGAGRIDFGVGATRTAGIYSDASNYTEIFTTTALPLVFSTNSVQRMRITSAGKVGIGTTAPFYKVGINTSEAAGPYGNSIAWHQHNNDNPFVGISFDDTNDGLSFNASVGIAGFNRQYMFINRNTGNVGIGTTSPTASGFSTGNPILDLTGTVPTLALHASGSTQQALIVSGGDGLILAASGAATATNNNVIRFYTEETNSQNTPTERVRIDSVGNVGVGKTDPTSKLFVKDSTGGNASLTYTASAIATFAGPYTSLSITGQNDSPFGLAIQTRNANESGSAYHLSINPLGGDVGIGTASLPSNKLTIVGSSNQLGIGDGTFRYDIGYDNSYLRFKNSAGDTHVVVNWSSGYVGIGTTSPGARLDIAQSIAGVAGLRVYNSHATEPYGLLVDNTVLTTGETYYVADFRSGGTSRLRINSSGNVGIGTNPSYKLDVSGSVRAGSANQTALLVTASGTATTQAAIAIQQLTTEGDTIIFADYEPYAEYGIIARNSLDSIDFTGGANTGSLDNYNVTNRAGSTRTAYVKARIGLGSGNSFFGGNVGIGTTSTGAKLDVFQAAGPQLRIYGNAVGANDAYIDFGADNAGVDIYGRIGIDVSTGSAGVETGGLFFSTINSGTLSKKVSILGDGNVGIGTTSPTTNKLTIVASSNQLGIGDGTYRYDISYDNSYLRFKNSAGDTQMVVNWSTGYVGIGTTSPGAKLTVKDGAIHLDKTNGLLYFTTDGAAGSTNSASFIGRADTAGYHVSSADGGFASLANSFVIGSQSGPLIFATTDAASYPSGRMIIDANGLVGIGIAVPTAPLHVSKAVNGDWVAKFVNTGTTPYGLSVDTSANAGTEYTFAAYTNVGTGLLLRNNGQLGIGTANPGYQLAVSNNGAAGIELGATNGNFGEIYAYNRTSSAYIPLILQAGGGNIGIGTTTPSNKLTVYDATAQAQAVFSGYSVVGARTNTDSGTIRIGTNAAFHGRMDYDAGGSTTLSIDNVYDHSSAAIQFRLRTAGTPVTALSLSGSGTVSIASTTAGSPNAGALVVQGGISAGQSAQASYFGGAVTVSGTQINIQSGGATDTLRQGNAIVIERTSASGNVSLAPNSPATSIGGAVTVGGTTVSVQAAGGGVANVDFLGNTGSPVNGRIQYDQVTSTSGQLFFQTANAGSLTTKLTLSNTGAATFAGAVTTGGRIDVTGGVSGGALTTSHGQIGGTTNGLELIGQGVTNDVTIYNKNGSQVFAVPTGTVDLVFNNGAVSGISTLSTTGAATFAGAVTVSGTLTNTAAQLGTFTSTTANGTSGEGNFTVVSSNTNTDTAYGINRAPGIAIRNTSGTANSYGGISFQDGGSNATSSIFGIFENDANNTGSLQFATRPSGGSLTTALTLASTGAATFAGAVSDSIGDIRILPQNSRSAAYTTVLSDSGKHILHPSADTTARTITIDSNANVAYAIGTAITFINQNAAGALTIAITSDTMRLAGAGTTGDRTLAANGVATAVKITSTEWIISGTGLT